MKSKTPDDPVGSEVVATFGNSIPESTTSPRLRIRILFLLLGVGSRSNLLFLHNMRDLHERIALSPTAVPTV